MAINTKSCIPVWVQEAVQKRIDESDIGFCRNGFYAITVEKENEMCPDCGIEVWEARMPCVDWDDWNKRAASPSEERGSPTWDDFFIKEL